MMTVQRVQSGCAVSDALSQLSTIAMSIAARLNERSREGETNGKGPLDYVYGRLCDRWVLYCPGSVHHLGWFSNQRPNYERPLRSAKPLGAWQLPRCAPKFAVLAANGQLGDRCNLHHPGCGHAW